jgi:hypothetical protein
MKIVLFLLALVVGISTTRAQSVVTLPLVAGDTITNTDTVDKYLPQLSGGYSGVTIEVRATRVSGTAAGKYYLYQSLVSTPAGASSAVTIPAWGFPIDSLVVLNQTTNTKVFNIPAPAANFYRVMYTGSGTSVQATRTRYVPKIFQITP